MDTAFEYEIIKYVGLVTDVTKVWRQVMLLSLFLLSLFCPRDEWRALYGPLPVMPFGDVYRKK